jgi:hypothetical protein
MEPILIILLVFLWRTCTIRNWERFAISKYYKCKTKFESIWVDSTATHKKCRPAPSLGKFKKNSYWSSYCSRYCVVEWTANRIYVKFIVLSWFQSLSCYCQEFSDEFKVCAIGVTYDDMTCTLTCTTQKLLRPFLLFLIEKLEVKVKQSPYMCWEARRVPGGWGSQISWQSIHKCGEVSPTHRPPLTFRKYSWYSFLLETEGHNAVWRISMKNSNGTSANWTRDLPVYIAVLQSTAPLFQTAPKLVRGTVVTK